jgi:amidase
LIKNNIATADKMNNSGMLVYLELNIDTKSFDSLGGSFALLSARVKDDSTIAKKLREAGVIILGKANLSQWANYRSTNSTSGWSSHGGQVIAPYYHNQNPSGRFEDTRSTS